MRSSLILKIAFTLLVWILAGCQTASRNAIENNSERKSTPVVSEPQEYKIDGCVIPLPPEKTKFNSEVKTMKTVDGKRIKVTATNYHPNGEFTFTLNPKVFEQFPYNLMLHGKADSAVFSLRNVQEMKVKDKIFGYSFTAREVLEERNDNSIHAEPTLFTCFDFKGDGAFTYIDSIGDLSKIVPEWITK